MDVSAWQLSLFQTEESPYGQTTEEPGITSFPYQREGALL